MKFVKPPLTCEQQAKHHMINTPTLLILGAGASAEYVHLVTSTFRQAQCITLLSDRSMDEQQTLVAGRFDRLNDRGRLSDQGIAGQQTPAAKVILTPVAELVEAKERIV